MKLSAGTIGTLLFTAVATAAFVLMAKRPAVDVTAMSFGMPATTQSTIESVSSPTAEVTETEKEAPKADESTEATSKVVEPETTNEEAATDTKTEEEPAMPESSSNDSTPDSTTTN